MAAHRWVMPETVSPPVFGKEWQAQEETSARTFRLQESVFSSSLDIPFFILYAAYFGADRLSSAARRGAEMGKQLPFNNPVDESAAAVSTAVILRQNQVFSNQKIVSLVGVQLLPIVDCVIHDAEQTQMFP